VRWPERKGSRGEDRAQLLARQVFRVSNHPPQWREWSQNALQALPGLGRLKEEELARSAYYSCDDNWYYIFMPAARLCARSGSVWLRPDGGGTKSCNTRLPDEGRQYEDDIAHCSVQYLVNYKESADLQNDFVQFRNGRMPAEKHLAR
jgi:hypothetical protein